MTDDRMLELDDSALIAADQTLMEVTSSRHLLVGRFAPGGGIRLHAPVALRQ